MTSIQWTPQKNITGWGGGLTYKAGVTYTGLPYGQPIDADYVPWETSLEGFINAVNDPNSKMYTSKATYNKVAPYYSIDCSAFVSWAWGLGRRQDTSSIRNFATKISETSYQDAQVGDCLDLPGSHVVLITDIDYDSSGRIISIEISESTVNAATNYCCQVVRYGKGGSDSLDTLQTKYFGNGYTLYRSKTRDSVTYTHSCAVPLEDDVCDKCGLTSYAVTPVYAQVFIERDISIYAKPEMDEGSVGILYGENYAVITGYCTDKNYDTWYRLSDGGWIMARDVVFDRYLASVAVNNPSFPEGTLDHGAVFLISGEITSVNPIVNITATMGNQSISLDFDGIYSYSLRGSDIDNAMHFERLNDDSRYTFRLTIRERSYCDGGHEPEYITTEYSSDFMIGEPPCIHSYGAPDIVDATCMQSGLRTYTCVLCRESYSETIPAKGHDTRTSVTNPTCTEPGFSTIRCTRCDYISVENETEPMGHDYHGGSCSRCGLADPDSGKGDLNGDGDVTSADAVLLARYLADLAVLTDAQLEIADVNGDGSVSSADAVMLARYLAGVISELG